MDVRTERIRVRFADGTELEVPRGTTLEELARLRGADGAGPLESP